MNFFDSSSWSLNDFGKAAMPATMPQTMNRSEMIDQMTPQHWEEPP